MSRDVELPTIGCRRGESQGSHHGGRELAVRLSLTASEHTMQGVPKITIPCTEFIEDGGYTVGTARPGGVFLSARDLTCACAPRRAGSAQLYAISVHLGVEVWAVRRRYSEFEKLQGQVRRQLGYGRSGIDGILTKLVRTVGQVGGAASFPCQKMVWQQLSVCD